MSVLVAAHPSATMKAIVQERYGVDALRLRDIDKPVVADDQVLVRVRAASINASDYHVIRGALMVRLFVGFRKPKDPYVGSDVAGVVEAVGKNVTRFAPGDEVFGTAHGAFAEYVAAREDRLVPKPRRLTFEQAAAVPIAATTALQGLRDHARMRPGQRVLIYGAGGGVGTFAVQIAKALGAHVTAVTSTRNVDLVRSLGPDEVIDYTREDVSRRGQRYDVFVDIAATRPLGECRRVLEPNGTFVQIGAAKGNSLAVLGRLLAVALRSRVLKQRIVFFVAKISHEDLVVLADLIDTGRVSPAIDRTYQLSEITDAVRYLTAGQARAKVVVTVS